MIDEDGTRHDNLELTIEPEEYQSKESLRFSWAVQDYTKTILTIQLTFDDVTAVSTDIEPNQLEIKVWNPGLFRRESDAIPISF